MEMLFMLGCGLTTGLSFWAINGPRHAFMGRFAITMVSTAGWLAVMIGHAHG